MSFYATIQGKITYSFQEDLEKIVSLLKKYKFLNENNFFITEDGNPVSEKPDVIGCTLTIPKAVYRNLARFNFFSEDSIGCVIWTSTDGCFYGCVNLQGQTWTYDLKKWANLNGLGFEDVVSEENYAQYVAWQADVENEWTNNHLNENSLLLESL